MKYLLSVSPVLFANDLAFNTTELYCSHCPCSLKCFVASSDYFYLEVSVQCRYIVVV